LLVQLNLSACRKKPPSTHAPCPVARRPSPVNPSSDDPVARYPLLGIVSAEYRLDSVKWHGGLAVAAGWSADEGKKPSVTALTREAEPFTVSFAVSHQSSISRGVSSIMDRKPRVQHSCKTKPCNLSHFLASLHMLCGGTHKGIKTGMSFMALASFKSTVRSCYCHTGPVRCDLPAFTESRPVHAQSDDTTLLASSKANKQQPNSIWNTYRGQTEKVRKVWRGCASDGNEEAITLGSRTGFGQPCLTCQHTSQNRYYLRGCPCFVRKQSVLFAWLLSMFMARRAAIPKCMEYGVSPNRQPSCSVRSCVRSNVYSSGIPFNQRSLEAFSWREYPASEILVGLNEDAPDASEKLKYGAEQPWLSSRPHSTFHIPHSTFHNPQHLQQSTDRLSFRCCRLEVYLYCASGTALRHNVNGTRSAPSSISLTFVLRTPYVRATPQLAGDPLLEL
jgi:hypothetical protein